MWAPDLITMKSNSGTAYSWSGSLTFIGSIDPLISHAVANCLPEEWEQMADYFSYWFSTFALLLSYNIDFSMDCYLTRTHSNSQYQLHLNLCALVMKHCTFIQITITLMFEYLMSLSDWITMTGNQHTSAIVFQAICIRYCAFGLLWYTGCWWDSVFFHSRH